MEMIDVLHLDVRSTWVNKAQYVDAERKFHIAMQNKNEDATQKPDGDTTTLQSVENLRLEAQSIWINKAQYVDAERKFQIAMQNQNKDATAKPDLARLKKNKSSKIQVNQVDAAKLADSLEALNILAKKSQYADTERSMEQRQEKQASKKKPTKPTLSAKILKPSNTKTEKSRSKSESSKKVFVNQRNGLTPYQGNKRCFGEFHCKRCHRKWQSGFSWANMGQQCKKCNWMIYPYKQHQARQGIEARRGNDENGMRGVHDVQKCEKCQNINGDCRSYW